MSQAPRVGRVSQLAEYVESPSSVDSAFHCHLSAPSRRCLTYTAWVEVLVAAGQHLGPGTQKRAAIERTAVPIAVAEIQPEDNPAEAVLGAK